MMGARSGALWRRGHRFFSPSWDSLDLCLPSVCIPLPLPPTLPRFPSRLSADDQTLFQGQI